MLTLEDLKQFVEHQEKVHSELYALLKIFAANYKSVGQEFDNSAYKEKANIIENATITEIDEVDLNLEWHEYWNYGGYEHHRISIKLHDLLNYEYYHGKIVEEQLELRNKRTLREIKQREIELNEQRKEYERLKKKFEDTK